MPSGSRLKAGDNISRGIALGQATPKTRVVWEFRRSRRSPWAKIAKEIAALKELKILSAVFLGYLLVLVALYWTTLDGGPLIDDFRLLDTAKHGGWLANFPATSPGVPGLFWRPMVSIFLKVEWSLFHLNFAGYRLVSAALCALTAASIYAVIQNLTQSRKAAIVAGLFFVLWPSHPETIVWIAGQTDGLATCLSWLALWAFLVNWQKPLWLSVLWMAPLIAGLFAKESAIVMPLLLLSIALALKSNAPKARIGLFTLTMLALTYGYLSLRGHMLHQSLLGGGYQSGSSHSLLQALLSGLLNYHLSLNLLNAYGPLSNRFFTGVLGWSADSLITILIVFGVGAVVRKLPRAHRRNPLERRLIPFAVAANLIFAIWAMFGLYPLAFLLSVAEIPMGLVAIIVILALLAAIGVRNKAQIGTQVRLFAANCAYVMVPVVALAACVAHEAALSRVPQETLYLYAATFWLLLYLTRPLKDKKDTPSTSMPQTALVFALASIVALIPILTIRQVDDNLALARLSYLATSFSVPALVLGISAIARRRRAKQLTLAAVGLLLLTAVVPVIQTWTHSVQLSNAYVEAIQGSKAQRIYVLVSPGIVPSATTVVLGGPFLDASGRLVRDDNPQVIPAFYADSFTGGDHIKVGHLTGATWRVTASAGPSKVRSGRLLLLPCYNPSAPSPFQSSSTPGDVIGEDVEIKGIQPSDQVLAVTEEGVIQLTNGAPQAP